ncbi:hypothetical protein [Rhodococcus sp. MEB032]|uniref:hypothetical protein n=1 Tax=Rhodococcus sp. MEB032 TaxID=3040322 RepID=UPI00254A5DCB|nr:hypothetical protein [Rhodococcus sp. MEB032]
MATFSPQGQAEFDKKLAAYKVDLLKEADRREADTRFGGGPQEITAQHVGNADLLIRQGMLKRKRHWGESFLVLGSPGGAFAAGWATNNLNTGLGVLVLVIAVVVALGCEAVRYVRGAA